MIFLIFILCFLTLAITLVIVFIVKTKWLNEAIFNSNKVKKIKELNQQFEFKKFQFLFRFKDFFSELNKYKKNDLYTTISKFRNQYNNRILEAFCDLCENQNKFDKYIAEFNKIKSEAVEVNSNHKINLSRYIKKESEKLENLRAKPILKITFDIWYEYISPKGQSKWESEHYFREVSNISDPYDALNKLFPVAYKGYEPTKDSDGSIFQQNDNSNILLSVNPSTISTNQLAHQSKYVLGKIKDNFDDKLLVKASLNINFFGKIIFDCHFYDISVNKEITYKRFSLLSSNSLLKKYQHLCDFIFDFNYAETGEQIIGICQKIKCCFEKENNFDINFEDILSRNPEDIVKTIKIQFCFNQDGDLYISESRIGTVYDLDTYFEMNPDSRYVSFFEQIKKDIENINKNIPIDSKLKKLKNKYLDSSNRFISFEYLDKTRICIFVSLHVNSIGQYTAKFANNFFNDSDIVDAHFYKSIALDKRPYKLFNNFKKSIDEINRSGIKKKSKILKLICVLADEYISTNEFQIEFSEEIRNSKEWGDYFDFVPDVEPLDLCNLKEGHLILNDNIGKIMRNYQKYAFNWMSKLVANNLSGILADDMGLGKTLEIISVINADKTEKPNLIVCPLSLTSNWKKEFFKWAPDEKVKILTSKNLKFLSNFLGNQKINIIASYAFVIYHLDLFRALDFNMIILDEAQYIKNSETQRAAGLKKLKSKTRFALTGTPIENKENDLWSIFEFLCPQLFDEYKIHALSDENKKRYIKPFILRRKKAEVLSELPSKNEIDIRVQMDDIQKGIYERYVNTATDYKDEPIALFGLLTRLREICIAPVLIDESAPQTSSKIEQMFNILENIILNNESVLIYSFFASAFPFIEKELNKKEIKYLKLTGDTTSDQRQKLINTFDEKDDIKVFLISLKAGGVGLNLTKANNVIFLDPWWNIAVENQAADRVHRIGQTKNVNVYRLICSDSIEEKVIDKQKEKIEIINYFIESGNETPISKFTFEEIKDLLLVSKKEDENN